MHDAQIQTAGIRRQPAHVTHVFVEAPQFFINRRIRPDAFGDDTIGAQYDEQMTKSGAHVFTRAAYQPGATALRQMVFNKSRGQRFIDLTDRQPIAF